MYECSFERQRVCRVLSAPALNLMLERKHTPLCSPLTPHEPTPERGRFVPQIKRPTIPSQSFSSPLCVADCVEARGDVRGVCFCFSHVHHQEKEPRYILLSLLLIVAGLANRQEDTKLQVDE